MLGTGLQFGRNRGEDRFYVPVKARRSHQKQQQEQLRRAQSDVTASQSPLKKEKPLNKEAENRKKPLNKEAENREKPLNKEAENREKPLNKEAENPAGSGEPPKAVAVSGTEPVVSPLCNLERFLESITPSIPAQYLSKTTMRGWRTCDVEYQPYFELRDLWESFKEWSAYGAGVPLVLNGSDCVVQYYVPYLSGIQIYADSSNSPVKSRRPGEESDSDYFRDSSSEGSSDCEPERGLKYLREQCNHRNVLSENALGLDRLSLMDQQVAFQEDSSSDEGESLNSQRCLLFEYLERDPPYSRGPLADKIADLTCRFPELNTLRSCDLLSCSWISVAWYPIYRIPTGPTLKDLDACFLTFHSLHTPIRGAQNAQAPVVTYSGDMDGVPKISLPVFGLATYKFKGSLWISNGGCEHQLVNSLLQAADKWLRLLQVNHPDFLFFCRR